MVPLSTVSLYPTTANAAASLSHCVYCRIARLDRRGYEMVGVGISELKGASRKCVQSKVSVRNMVLRPRPGTRGPGVSRACAARVRATTGRRARVVGAPRARVWICVARAPR